MKEPVYKQIEVYLRELIDTGKIKPGELLPSENHICEEFNVTRMTVRAAFNNLVKEGYISRKRGIGSIVLANKISDNIGAMRGFTDEMTSKGYSITTKLIELNIIEADKSISEKLEIEKESNVWQVKRVRYSDEIAISYMVTYMPVSMFPNLRKEKCNSLYKYIEECHYTIGGAKRSVEAVISDEGIMDLLDLEDETPLLYIEQVARIDTGEVFEYSHTYHHGYKLTLNAVPLKIN